jgi:hypothetical protein
LVSKFYVSPYLHSCNGQAIERAKISEALVFFLNFFPDFFIAAFFSSAANICKESVEKVSGLIKFGERRVSGQFFDPAKANNDEGQFNENHAPGLPDGLFSDQNPDFGQNFGWS